jgi:hypothetical protein
VAEASSISPGDTQPGAVVPAPALPAWLPSAGIAAVATLLILISSGLRATPYNNYVLLADAFLHGHVWIDWPGPAIDALRYHDRYYVIEGPLPVLFVLPLVAAFGAHANQSIVAALFGGVAVGAAWEVATRLGVLGNTRLALVAFFMAGTDLWWCAMYGDVWFIAHAAAVCFTMLAIAELLGQRRGWLVGLFAACAVGSRFNLALALPAFAYLLARARPRAEATRNVVAFCAVLLPFIFAWVAYNEARWQVPYDIGYSTWYHEDQLGDATGSPFKLKYVPFEAWSFFLAAPHFEPVFPWMRAPNAGIAVTWTSPALLLALLARQPRYLVLSMAAVTIAIWVSEILYYANGASQFGMRHLLDFLPFLFVLMLLGVRDRLPLWGGALLAYSIAFGFWGLWYWRMFFRPTY